MKLRLPNKLVAAILAACGVACTLPSNAGDTISVNYYDGSFNITNQTGTVGGVGASGWTNVAPTNGNVSTNVNLINQAGQATQNTYLTTQIQSGMWGNNEVDESTVEGKLLRAYIDVSNHSTSHYYIDFASDYAVTSLTLYFSGDGALFAPVEINGTRYIGAEGVASPIAADATTSWGDRTTAGSKTITNNNSFALSGVAGGVYHLTNVYTGNNDRASLAGFQVTDISDTLAWNATLASGTTSVENVQWEKASESVPAELAQALASVSASADGSTLALGDGATYNVIQSTSGDLTLTGSNLTIHGLHAKENSKLTLNASLVSTETPTIGGYGTVALGSNVTAASAKDILMNSLAPKTTLELNQKVTIAVGEKSTFGGTLVINNAETDDYNDGSNTQNRGYDLVLGNNTYNNSADISSVSKLVLNNAGIYYAGNGTTIHNLTLNKNSNSRLKVEHMGSGVLTFAGETALDQGSHMTAVSRWTSNVTFERLTGNGTLTLQGAPNDSNDVTTYTINSLQGFSGTLDLAKGSGQCKEIVTINTGTGSDVALTALMMSGTTGKGYTVTLAGSQVLSISGASTLSSGTLQIAEGAKLEINKAGSLTDAIMTVSGGNLESAGTLCIGRKGSGGGNLNMTSGSIKAKEILSAWGGDINLTGGTLEFTGGDEVSSIRKGTAQGDSPTASANVTFNGVTLKAASTAWKVDGNALSNLTIGNLTVSSDTQNVITIANAVTRNEERTITNNSTGDGKLVLDSLELNNRLNIGGAGVTEFANGSSLSNSFSPGAYSLVANADVTLKGSESSYAWGNSKIAVNTDKTLTVDSGAKLVVGDIRYTETVGGKHGIVSVGEGGSVTTGGILRLQGITNNGTVELSNDNEKTVGFYEQGSTGKLTLNNDVSVETSKKTDGTISGSFELGNNAQLNIKNIGSSAVSMEDLTLADDATMGLYNGENLQPASTNEAGVILVGTLTAGEGATLNANLTMESGSTLIVQQGGLGMGSSLTLSNGMNFELHGATVTDGKLENFILYTGVDEFFMPGNVGALTEGWYDAKDDVIGRNIILNIVAYDGAGEALTLNQDSQYVIGYWNGTVSIAETSVPEPATATLSLLALAALAARRRRK